jgi:hypothetical protein
VSSRPPVDRERIEKFLTVLGQRFTHEARIYLVGGSTMVLAGLRSQTIDIDIDYWVDDRMHGALVNTLRQLKEELRINIEEVSPAHFIPLPKGHAERARYVNRYGKIDVYHFDPYSTALAKLERGREEDLRDVEALLDAGWLDWSTLEETAAEIVPRMATESLKGEPDRLLRHLGELRRRQAQSS